MRWFTWTMCLSLLSIAPLAGCSCGEPEPCQVSEVKFTAEENKKIFGLSPLPTMPTNPTNKYADDPKASKFGQFLFYDVRLSSSPSGGGKHSCKSCHEPDKGWSDGKPLSAGVGQLPIHSPTLWNIGYNHWFFWNGRADTAWAQATKPIEAPAEMDGNRFRILKLIAKEDAKLKAAYEAIFGSDSLPSDLLDKYKFDHAKPLPDDPDNEQNKNWDSISDEDKTKINKFYTNITKALEAYQRKIVSNNAPFDEFVQGIKTCDPTKAKAISASAQRGLKIFVMKDSCISCHDGPNFSDSEFHNIGLPVVQGKAPDVGRIAGLSIVLNDPFNGLGPFSDTDKDDKRNERLRFLRSDNPNTIGEMKTPTLRSVDTSGPYMHDGRFKTLDDVVSFYSHFGAKDISGCIKLGKATYTPPKTDPNAKIQDKDKCKIDTAAVGLREETMLLFLLTDQEQKDVVNFLKTLTGKALPKTLTTQPDSPM